MSYSIQAPCFNCTKKNSCTDLSKITAVVQDVIHQTSFGDGHQGSGWVTLTCTMQSVK